jgi:hypothetical protein
VAASERHSDGSVETHQPGSIGVYVANLEFDQPGDWGLELTGKAGGKDLGSVKVRLPVRAQEIGIAVGSPAPKSVQTTLRDVARLDEIDTSSIPDPVMHGQTVAEALASKYPTVIVFATPGFCRSRICGPVKAIVDDLDKTFGRSVNFVHIEPYDLAKARNGQLSPIPLLEQEWHLSTEPWIFVVGRDGLVKAKFEAAVDKEEVEAVLRSLLAP